MSIEPQRAARRAAMPITTAFFEQYVEFAPTLVYAVEGSHKYGKPPAEENAFQIPPGYRIATHVEKVKK